MSSFIGSLISIIVYIILVSIPALIFYFIFHLFKNNSKIKTYKRFSILLLIIGCIIVLFTGLQYLDKNSSSNTDNVTSASGFNIESYNVKLNVNENNVVDVTESIDVNFYSSGLHGIYKFIPNWLEYTGKDGTKVSRYSDIIDLKAVGEEYSLDTVNGKQRIKIGSSDNVLSTGRKSYVITYQYNMGNDPFKGYDEFIFHTFGDYWGTTINNASIELTMPSDIDLNNVKFYTDKYRQNDVSSYIDYKISGNTLYADVSSSLNLKKSLTIDLELPEGYFKNTTSSYGYTSLICCLLIIIFLVISFINWLKHGKDNAYIINNNISLDGYDASQIGYIYKKDSGRKLAISLIFELVSKGYIKIDEENGKIVITNLYPKKDIVNMTTNEKIVYDKLFTNSDVNILSEDKEFYKVFKELDTNLEKELNDKIYDVESYKYMAITSLLFYVATSLYSYSFSYAKDMNPNYNIMYFIALICIIILFVLAILMKRKNEYGTLLSFKVFEYKKYLDNIGNNQIEQLAKNNSNYYYEILPYAYVLGVSKAWSMKFKNIKIIDENKGNVDYLNPAIFDSVSDSLYYPSSSSSSSCGGGCSSCGGGCSSCGGGGSW